MLAGLQGLAGDDKRGVASRPGDNSRQYDGNLLTHEEHPDQIAIRDAKSASTDSSGPVLYYFVDHTARYPGNTGIQRVTRRLGNALHELGVAIRFVKWDEASGNLAFVDHVELDRLSQCGGPDLSGDVLRDYPKRGAKSVSVQKNNIFRDSWLIVPEVPHITYQATPVTLSLIMAAKRLGLKTAFVFYDAIPLRQPDLKDAAQHHQAYMHQLLMSDLVVPISQWSARDLQAFFHVHEHASAAHIPRIHPLALPGESHLAPRVQEINAASRSRNLILSVGSIVPHKNQLVLIEAFDRMCQDDRQTTWKLELAGHLHRDLARSVKQAASRNKRIRYLGPVSDEDLDELYRECTFTVFPSVQEGFGLPILESLWYAKPCICANFGAMAEAARGGGCLTTDTRSVHDVAAAIKQLSSDRELLEKLTREAVARSMAGWHDYARLFLRQLVDFTGTKGKAGTVVDGTESSPKMSEAEFYSEFANLLR